MGEFHGVEQHYELASLGEAQGALHFCTHLPNLLGGWHTNNGLADYQKAGVPLEMAFVGPDLTEARLCGCEGVEQQYRLDDQLAQVQQISDLFIFLSYFSIPLELLYFLACSKLVFPFKWIIVQFGAFIVLCGLTHLVAMWTYHEHTYAIALTQTVMKGLTALVSCATALTLVSRPILCSSKGSPLTRAACRAPILTWATMWCLRLIDMPPMSSCVS